MAVPGAQTLWYIARDGQQFGPLLIHEIQERFRSGQVLPTDYMWCAEVNKWILAGEVFGMAPPPPPPVAPQRSSPSDPTGPQSFVSGPSASHAANLGADRQSQNGHTKTTSQNQQTTTQTVIEGGTFKFNTLLWIIAGLLIPFWPISLPICWYQAYKSYHKPSVRTVQVISS